jgi:hypothetical protein
MLLHDTVVIPATNVKALRSNILFQPAPRQEMNLFRMKETKERRKQETDDCSGMGWRNVKWDEQHL